MGVIVKSALILLLIAIAGGFLINQVPAWKERVIEVINPAAKEARLLGELKVGLDELGNNVTDPKNKGLLEKSKNLVDQISSANNKNSGIVRQQVSKIIDAFLDKTPYPADHLNVPAASQSPLVCPPR